MLDMQLARVALRVGREARTLLDGLFSLDCSFCGSPTIEPRQSVRRKRSLCEACAAALPWWRIADGCPRCGMPSDPARPGSEAAWGRGTSGPVACPRCLAEGSPLHRCFAAARHVGPIARLIPAFKNPRGPFGPPLEALRAVDYLVANLAERVEQEWGRAPDVVTSVPLHRRRLHRRGFNHADWIADRVGRALGCRASLALLDRIRDTGSQAGRTAAERRAALRGAFRARSEFVREAKLRVFLVDDVLTTGSTLESAAEALLAAGAGEVVALTLSATVAGASVAIRDSCGGRPRIPRRQTP